MSILSSKKLKGGLIGLLVYRPLNITFMMNHFSICITEFKKRLKLLKQYSIPIYLLSEKALFTLPYIKKTAIMYSYNCKKIQNEKA